MNEHGQPIGLPVTCALPRPRPAHIPLAGHWATLTPTRESDAQGLLDAFAEDTSGKGWTYLPDAPWISLADATAFCRMAQGSADPMFYTVTDRAGVISGFLSLLRIDPGVGSVEVGYIHFAPRLQRTPTATEAIFLLLSQCLDDLGYRRFEWKCDALNAPSRAAAQRFGFAPEGVFRNATVYKGRSRDTAWFAMTDGDWQDIRPRYAAWLSPENFDDKGQQIKRLQDCG
ncbi:GNAT family N-acetyltransferase [Tropicibacter naphthalenivorans]|nr:GNAT family protein [Tropicibacter naphthalenivorans]